MKTLIKFINVSLFLFAVSANAGVGNGIGGGKPTMNGMYGNNDMLIGGNRINQQLPSYGGLGNQNYIYDPFKVASPGLQNGSKTVSPSVDTKVLFIQKQHSELVYDVAVPGENQVIRLNQRPEEFKGLEGQQVLEALKKSSATKQWIELNQLSNQGGK